MNLSKNTSLFFVFVLKTFFTVNENEN